jgi:peptidoglycan hydrolase CwlO-like protein
MKMRLSHVVLVLWLMTIIGFVWYWSSKDSSVNPNPNYEQTIKKLEQQNDSLLAINQGLQEQIAEQLEKQEGIKEELKKRNKDLKQLKYRKSEKIRAIGNYDNDELYRFFSEFETESLYHSE